VWWDVVQSCKDLPGIKLGLDAGMSALDVGVGVGTPGRDETMLSAEVLDYGGELAAIVFHLIALEFGAVVRLHNGFTDVDAEGFQVFQQADGGKF